LAKLAAADGSLTSPQIQPSDPPNCHQNRFEIAEIAASIANKKEAHLFRHAPFKVSD
jgi:hypothetical protein